MALRIPVPRSIRAQLLALVLAVALPAVGLVAYNIVDAANEARQAAYGQVRIVAREVTSRIELVLRDNEALLARLAERPRIKALDARDCEPIIAEFVSLHPDYTTLGLRDRDANAVCTFLRPALGSERVRAYPWFAEGLRRGRFMVGDAFFGPQTGRWVLPLTHPVRDASGNVSGLLLVTLDLLALQQRVLGALSIETIVVMFDRDNRYLMRSIRPADWIGKPLPRAQLDQLPVRGEDVFEMTSVDGVTRLNAGAVVASSGWRVYAGLPTDLVLAAHRERLARSVAAGMVVLLLALGLAYAIGRAIARPIGDLARTASDIADGGIPAVGPIKGAAEIQAAASGLHRLAGERARQRDERTALAAHYDQLIKMARDIVLLVDPSGHIVEANDAAAAAYGYGADELRGIHVRDLRPPEVQAATEQDWQATTSAEGVLFETVHRRKDGSTFPVEISARAIEVAGRLYRQAFVRDISERKHAEQALRKSEQRFSLAASTGNVWDWSLLTNQVTFPQEFWRGLGYDGPDIRNPVAMFESVLHPEDLLRWRQAVNDHIRRRLPYDLDFRARAKSGEYRWFNTKGQAQWDENGQATYMAGTTFDITERKQAEGELIASERRYRALFENMTAGFVLFEVVQDDRGAPIDLCILAANKEFELTTGLKLQDVTGRRLTRVLPGIEDDAADWIGTYGKVALTGEARQFEQRSEHLGIHYSVTAYQAGPKQCAVTFVDITERKRAEEALRENRATLEALTRRLLEVQETERRTLARELHDEVGGVLTAVKLNLQSLRGKREATRDEGAIADGLALVDGAIQAVRSLSLDLRPAVLDDLGLIPALKWYCERQSMRAGIAIELALDAIDLKSAPQLESACFRIAQEAVTNALRHANARRIEVALRRDDGHFALKIADDGGGFDVAAARKRGLAGESSGLLGMEERVKLLGGRLAIDSAPGAGTRIDAEFAIAEGGFG